MTATINLLGLDRVGLEAFFTARGEKTFRASQILKWIHHFGVLDYAEMTNISKALRQRLHDEALAQVPEIVSEHQSSDGTRKWVVRVDNGNCVETVYIPEAERGTLCVSSQVGCALACSFCSTGKQGFSRNLSTAEIIGQLWLARQRLAEDDPLTATSDRRHITNVVMMGMGEPLMNFDNVVAAMNIMTDDFAYNLSKWRVTLSTAGVVPAIDRLCATRPVSLAVSLHAPTDELRNELVPINKTYPLKELLAACRRYAQSTRTAITFEYVMLDGINDSVACARELARRLRGIPAKMNLIPFNPFPQAPYRRSTAAALDAFRQVLLDAGLITITRKTRGDDIDAACGQLVGQVAARAERIRRQSKNLPGVTHQPC